MNPLWKRIETSVVVGGIGLLMLGMGCYEAGARINTTRSIPVGLYWTSKKLVEKVDKGDYVFFCPPKNDVFDMAKNRGYISAGFCPGDYGYMMKRVLAVENDVVTVADEGVRVNGNLLPLSAVRKVDKGGRPLAGYQPNNYRLRNSEVLLMSDVSGLSFDGRYFGPINRSQIKTVISPVITW